MSSVAKPRTIDVSPAPAVLHGVLYGDCVRLRDESKNRHLRMVYHDGVLEIMSPESLHELSARLVGIFIYVLCVELKIGCVGTRSTTFRRGTRHLKKGQGKEPYESFYFANAQRVLGKNPIDLDGDPPPDLWIEIDHRASSRDRLPLYAALGVPEVWRLKVERDKLWLGRLVDGRRYESIDRSLSLPMLNPPIVLQALEMKRGIMEITWDGRLRPWIRETFGSRDESPT